MREPVASSMLERGFVAPPDSVKISTYWYWISGNVSKEGVAEDLRSMKAAGIDRAYIGNIGHDDVPYGAGRADERAVVGDIAYGPSRPQRNWIWRSAFSTLRGGVSPAVPG